METPTPRSPTRKGLPHRVRLRKESIRFAGAPSALCPTHSGTSSTLGGLRSAAGTVFLECLSLMGRYRTRGCGDDPAAHRSPHGPAGYGFVRTSGVRGDLAGGCAQLPGPGRPDPKELGVDAVLGTDPGRLPDARMEVVGAAARLADHAGITRIRPHRLLARGTNKSPAVARNP